MNKLHTTMNQIFTFTKQTPRDSLEKTEYGKTILALQKKITEKIKTLIPSNEIEKNIEEFLNIPIQDIMLSAWAKHGFLQKYIDKKKYPPKETIVVHLTEHTVESEHHPYIEILINNKPVLKIQFDISVALEIKGVGLVIKGGKIKEIQSGKYKGNGIIKYKNTIILKRESIPISLPGSINLGSGVSIAN